MRVLITGASGLIGKALQRSFTEKGYEMLLAGRSEPKAENQIKWDVENGFSEPQRLEGLEVLIHLAGENIGGGLRWTEEKKKALRDSRVLGTRSVVDAIIGLKEPPKAFISGSAIGFYGDRGDEELTEDSQSGSTFLSDLCREWEGESMRAEEFGIPTALLRTGIVLSADGGALATMLTPFKLGVGGVVGSGKQWMSWISLDDVVGVINFILKREHFRGAVNVVSPNPVTNKEFTAAFGEVLHRPAIFPLPKFAVNLVFGEMGDALLLDSTRVIPKRLEEAGYEFRYPHLKPALKHALE